LTDGTKVIADSERLSQEGIGWAMEKVG
jgi:hypothetical protein